MEERYLAGVFDVVMLGDLYDDTSHDFVVNGLLHELRRHGVVAKDYAGPTLRENFGLGRLKRSSGLWGSRRGDTLGVRRCSGRWSDVELMPSPARSTSEVDTVDSGL